MEIKKNVTIVNIGSIPSHVYLTLRMWLVHNEYKYSFIPTGKNTLNNTSVKLEIEKGDVDRLVTWIEELGL